MTRKPDKAIVQLTASRFFGGPERQMLELAAALPDSYRTVLVSFSEEGLCRDFLEQVGQRGFEGVALKYDMPRLVAAEQELVRLLRHLDADILYCHGYKANLLGLVAARRLGIPVVAVSRGWTGETWRVRVYDILDRFVLRRMDRIVCVSEGQAARVRRAGVPHRKITVIHNAIRVDRFSQPRNEYRKQIEQLFPQSPDTIVGAAGRLSPEKGFDILIDAAAKVVRADSSVGFVLFGEGALRGSLARRIEAHGLDGRFVLAGFQPELDRYIPHFDLLTVPSHTEGLPNVVLEAHAAGVPVVATAVGGTPEVVEDGTSGYLVPPGDSAALARRITELLTNETMRRDMGLHGRDQVLKRFAFSNQAQQYRKLFDQLTSGTAGAV